MFVRDLLACEPGRVAECVTSFSPDDPIFRGHFPGDPLVPGVILTEALAQTAGIAAGSAWSDCKPPLFLLSAIRGMKFLRPVRPAEPIDLRAEKLAHVGDLMQFAVQATVNGAVVAEGQLVLTIARRE